MNGQTGVETQFRAVREDWRNRGEKEETTSGVSRLATVGQWGEYKKQGLRWRPGQSSAGL